LHEEAVMIKLRQPDRPYAPNTPIVAEKLTFFIDWVPTGLREMDAFFELAPVSADDVVYDLGSGDGRLVMTALEMGAGKAVGIEIDPRLISEAKAIARSNGFNGNLKFIEADFMTVDLSDASVVLCFLSPEIQSALKTKLESELKPGARVVTRTFGIAGWKPDGTTERDGEDFYLYIMSPDKSSR
jgi:ribosomal protein L11 methylase PrmA